MSSKNLTWEDIIETQGMLEAQIAMIEIALTENVLTDKKKENYQRLLLVLSRANRDITILSEKHRSLAYLYGEKVKMEQHKNVIISDLVSL